MDDRPPVTNVIFDEGADKLGIPNKWPAMVVAGKKITEAQAAEILIRTDCNLPDFGYAGNDSHHAARLNRLFNIPSPREVRDNPDRWREQWDRTQSLKDRLGKFSLEYLGNDQIVSSFVGGPHGWVNWRGDVFTNSYNIGKWPNLETVAHEWGVIANAFPFLDLRCQLFDGETCEDATTALVEFVISDGVVFVTAPRSSIAPPVSLPLNPAILFGSPARERGISVEELSDKLIQNYGEEYPKYDDPIEEIEE